MTTPGNPIPPPVLESLLGRCVPDGAAGRASVLGDLHEEYLRVHRRRGGAVANLWYAGQVVALGLPWMASSLRRSVARGLSGTALDFRSSLRGLRRHPTLVTVGVLSLALGSGLVTAAATMVNGAWFAPLPWEHSRRMVQLEDTHPTEIPRGLEPLTSMRSFEQWRMDLPAGIFDRLEASMRSWVPVRVKGGAPSHLRTIRMSGGYADLFELEARIGRLISPADTKGGAEPVVVLHHDLWRVAFDESPEVLGQLVTVDGVDHTVIGVLRADQRMLDEAELLLPMPPAPFDATFAERGVQVLGVLGDGVSVQAADAAIRTLASGMYAAADELSSGWSATATPLRQVLADKGVSPAVALAAIVLCIIVLLVAALNLASLLLARTTGRSRELAVRAALGAGGVRVARAALMDGLVLAGMGGALGLVVVVLGRDLAVLRFAAELPSWASFPIDLRVLLVAMGGTVIAALIISLLPVVRAAAIGRRSGLVRSAVAHSPAATPRAQNLLLGGQIVLGLVLVTASVAQLRSFSRASDFERLGYRWEGLTGVAVHPEPDDGGYATARVAEQLALAADGYRRVRASATTRHVPLSAPGRSDASSPVRIGGADMPLTRASAPDRALAVSPGYFALLEIPIEAGRPIGESDDLGAPPAAVISSDAARKIWPEREPASLIGETLEIEAEDTRAAYSVVGIAGPVILSPTAADGATNPTLYLSLRQTPDALYGNATSGIQLRVETGGVPPTIQEWGDWVDSVVPGARVSQVSATEDLLQQWVRPLLVMGAILGGLALLVLALVSVGIYGTVSYRIAHTRHEIGVRLALGADAQGVVRSVAEPLARVVFASVALGTGVAWMLRPVLAQGGLQTQDSHPGVMAGVAMLIILSAAGAAAGPLRRALSIDPSRSLRAD